MTNSYSCYFDPVDMWLVALLGTENALSSSFSSGFSDRKTQIGPRFMCFPPLERTDVFLG